MRGTLLEFKKGNMVGTGNLLIFFDGSFGLYRLYVSFAYFVEVCPSINATVAEFTSAF